MKIMRRPKIASRICTLLLFLSGAVFAAQPQENTAHIEQNFKIPTMSISINTGGTGCNQERHEVWEPTGCSNTEWAKSLRVVSVTAAPSTILANNSDMSILVATVKDSKGEPAGQGIPTTWTTTNGTLSSSTAITNAQGQSSVTLRGTVSGPAIVTAVAVAGGSSGQVMLVPDASTTRVVRLVSDPSRVAADGTKANLFATVRDAYNNIPPAGHPVYWSNTLNTLSTGLSYTGSDGVAFATISGTSSGTATIYAKTPVSDNASTTVAFESQKPIIESFTETADDMPLVIYVNYKGTYTASYPGAPLFKWTVRNADRYELFSPVGLVYSGTENSYLVPLNTYIGSARLWTLKAYKNNQVTEKTLYINELGYPDCGGCSSGS
ncbi:Ig-like domain-containing protein [Pseudomonas helleri]|uniref:Ig-like domain-containing protein n=1 Tax=Pseudomonas helleri TaxID=1608996 RepID=UPI003FCF92C3